MQAPTKIIPKSDADYLEVMTKAVFQSGFSWAVIENKWSGFQEAFDAFDPQTIANYNDEKQSELQADTRIIRNGSKINATIHNARTMLAKSGEFGSFKAYLDSFTDFESAVTDLQKSFKWLGEFGSFYFLYVVNQPVPSYEAWCHARGITPVITES